MLFSLKKLSWSLSAHTAGPPDTPVGQDEEHQLGLGDGLLLDGDLLILCVCIPERIKLLKKEYTDQKKLKKFKKYFVTNKILEEFYTRILQV